MLRFKGIGNWQEIDVNSLGQKNCNPTLRCNDSGDVCKETDEGKTKTWTCGMPKLSKALNVGEVLLGNGFEPGEDGYAHGTCGIHVVQHQKDDPATDPYSLEVWIKDANQDDIGSKYPAVSMGDGPLVVDSKLPDPVEFETGAMDADPVTIRYQGKEWTADMGDYDGGKREGDSNFECA